MKIIEFAKVGRLFVLYKGDQIRYNETNQNLLTKERIALFTILKRRELNPTVTELWIHAPLIAKKAKAGQFIIVRPGENSERIPLTIAGYDREAGTVSIIFQVVGAGTMELNAL